MSLAVYDLGELRGDIYANLGRQVDLGEESNLELRESYIQVTDELAARMGQSALFNLTPEMIHVEPAPDAPPWIQGELFKVATKIQESN